MAGGGGGGRDTMAQAGGRDPEKLDEALAAARGGDRRPRSARVLGCSMRVLALDHGEARCGCAVSDPSGTLATPLESVERPDTRKGLARLAALAEELEAEKVVVGLPLTLGGRGGHQAEAGASGSPRGWRRGWTCRSRCTTSA